MYFFLYDGVVILIVVINFLLYRRCVGSYLVLSRERTGERENKRTSERTTEARKIKSTIIIMKIDKVTKTNKWK